jgi:cation diffusion facilitator CzcD-associated flavoprotein CzcO
MTAPTPRIAIIGAGFSGLCLAIGLLRRGIRSFTIFEKEPRLGGTWRDNTYPGACCDVPSLFYCFSFEQRTDWPRKWSPQSEIQRYMERTAEKYDVLPHVRFGTEIESARWDDDEGVWRIRTRDGSESVADMLVSGVGQLHKPYVPDLPGLESFRGERFHSARWRHDVPLCDKRVGVIGNAASAIQFIPQIAPEVGRLHVFQRTPNWMVPRGDRPYGPREQWLLAHVPGLAKLYRAWIWARAELLLYPAVIGHPRMSALLEKQAREHLRAQIPDPALRKVLTPDYPVGGKRVLISDDYYPALLRENVELVTDRVERITEAGVRCAGGREIELDVLVLATGFDTTHFVSPIQVEGRDGVRLDEVWKQGAEAYLGLGVSGFPNFFLMYGPNTNLGHNSILFMIEAQARYVLACVERLWREGLRAIEVRPEVMAAYNRRVQEALRGTAWDRTERSWYKNEAGRITNNWPWTTLRYWWETRRVDWSAYRLEPRDGGSQREASRSGAREAA